MPDVLTPTQRSYNMSQIRSKDTKPELVLRDILYSQGLGLFEMHSKQVEGNPDFYFPKQKLAVFVDGCFWHGCPKCFQMPATNKEFWANKIQANQKRDRRVNKKLKSHGISVVRIREHEIKKSPMKAFKKIEKKIHGIAVPKILDLFAGAGGFSEGFIRSGCDVIAHIEMDKSACQTLTTRMIYHALINRGQLKEYIKYVYGKITLESIINKYGLFKEKNSVVWETISDNNYNTLIDEVKERLNGQQLDMIIGGPPCQAYSYIGRARDINRMHLDDRNYLYKYYVKFLKSLAPKIFVFENVPGLLSAGNGHYLEDMRSLMKDIGYSTDYRIINATDYGIPQNRKRVFLVGWNDKSKLTEYPEFPKTKRDYRVRDFIKDLPKIKAGEGEALRRFCRKNDLLESLNIVNSEFGLLMDHIARPHNRQDLEIYKRAVLLKNKGKNLKYNDLPKRLKSHQNEKGFIDRFKVIDKNALGSHTVVAHISKDGHYYIHPALRQNRSITVREAARLQTFPDDYKFEGSRSSQFRQIGNAVPPMLSKILADELKNYL